jgi:hypothetical protein
VTACSNAWLCCTVPELRSRSSTAPPLAATIALLSWPLPLALTDAPPDEADDTMALPAAKPSATPSTSSATGSRRASGLRARPPSNLSSMVVIERSPPGPASKLGVYDVTGRGVGPGSPDRSRLLPARSTGGLRTSGNGWCPRDSHSGAPSAVCEALADPVLDDLEQSGCGGNGREYRTG